MKYKKTTLFATFLVCFLGIGQFVLVHGYRDIYKQHPDMDRKIARQAFRVMVTKAFFQKYSEAQMADKKSITETLYSEYHKILAT